MKNILATMKPMRAVVIAIAAVAPVAFPASQIGYGTLHDLAISSVIPAAALLLLAMVLFRRSRFEDIASLARNGAAAGALATFALEAVRYPGFRLGFMPGNLPELMGVLLLDRFALGPTMASTLAGFAYHFWIGACFGIIFNLGRFTLSNWWAIPYGLAIGVGFLMSPVVEGLGVGWFGVNFGWHFAATVLIAHLAFGASLAVLFRRNKGDWALFFGAKLGGKWTLKRTGKKFMAPSLPLR
jgi:hypothetical protein